MEQARGGVALTYFEFTTLAILHVLAGTGLDAMVLKTGMGGRLDAVNIIDADCAIITSVDIDHAEFLGATCEEIGREKAGISITHICNTLLLPAPLKKRAISSKIGRASCRERV